MPSLVGPTLLALALLRVAAESPASEGSCDAAPGASCECYEREDEKAACSEKRMFSRLVGWLQEGVHAHLSPAEQPATGEIADVLAVDRSQYGGRAVAAKRDLAVDEVFMRIPMQRLMHAGFFKKTDGAWADDVAALPRGSTLTAALHRGLRGREFLTFIAPQTWLAIYMMEHRAMGAASEWSPYLDTLPERFPTVPLFYTEEDWKWLEGSLFSLRVGKHRESLAKQFDTLVELVPDFNETYTFEEFMWARSAISSRVFGWSLPGLDKEDNDFMVPLGDMFNHRSPKQVEWRFNATSKTLDYKALEPVAAGEEILISYGGKCNSQYLLHYGFAVPGVSTRNPPVSTVRVAMDLDDLVPEREERERWLLKQRMKDEETLTPEVFELKPAIWKNGGAEAMLAYARLLEVPAGELQVRLKGRSCKKYATPPKCDQPMSLANELAALRRCAGAMAQQIAAYPTTLEQDEELLPTLSGLPRMLVILRRDEKVVLRHWKRFFDLALEAAELPEEKIGEMAEEAFGKYGAETGYLRTTLAAVLAVERKG